MIDPTIEALIAAATGADPNGYTDAYLPPDPTLSAHAAAKLHDALVSGFEPEFSPPEAEAAGAFLEDALSEQDAREIDPALPQFHAGLLPLKA